MNEWEKITLGEVAIITMGQSPKGEDCNTDGNGLPLLNGPTEFGYRNPSPVQFTTDAKKKAISGDILFCVRGSTTGRMNWADQQYAIGRGIASIRSKYGLSLQPYIKTVIDQNLQKLLAIATGSTFPNVSRDDLSSLEFLSPPPDIRNFISQVADNFDRKIENLRKQNETLEQIAQTLFKHWFVDFEFPYDPSASSGQRFAQGSPNADGTPFDIAQGRPYKSSGGEMVPSELGEIPAGWRVGMLGKFCDVKHGYAFKGEFITTDKTDKILLTPGNFRIGGGFNASKYKYYLNDDYDKDYILSSGDLIITMTDLSKEGDTLGYPAFVPRSGKSVFLHNQRIGKVVNSKINLLFLFFLLCRREYRAHILGSASGSTVRHTSPSRILDHQFAIPSQFLLDEFLLITSNLIKKTFANLEQIQTLTQTRDTLLPKLMSGQLRIQEGKHE